jgi:hypothetical protein
MIKWPCVFRDPLVKDANANLYAKHPKAPIGAFQRAWRTEHCSQLDTYGTGACPYLARDCVISYYMVADRTMNEATKSPVGLFRKLARAYGAKRADEKPLSREKIRTHGLEDARRTVDPGGDEGRRLRAARPRSIGDLLGGDDR